MKLLPSPLEQLNDPLLEEKELKVYIKRDDLLHPLISGNKWRKLKYNLQAAKEQNHQTILTFGGAFSNHIYSLAAAGKEFGFKTIGIIRGEPNYASNPTLNFAQSCGMQLHFVSREMYRLKEDTSFIDKLKKQFGNFYLLPEGGTNQLGAKGCEEIVREIDIAYDFLCTAVGTGGTISGLINEVKGKKKILGFPALKESIYLKDEISTLTSASYTQWEFITDFHFGGYAKLSAELVHFIDSFQQQHQIQLEPIYTGKLLFGVYQLIKNNYFPKGSTIIALHTGGLQGLNGLRKKMDRLRKG